MKTFWTIVGVIVLIIVLVIAWNQYQKNKAQQAADASKTTQKEYCERHGGTWNGTSCILYTQPETTRITVVPIVKPFNPGNGVNPAG